MRLPNTWRVVFLIAVVLCALSVLSASAGATPAAEHSHSGGGTCPAVEDVCGLAVALNRAAGQGDVDALLTLVAPWTYRCPGPVAGGAGGPYPLCDGSAPGEERTGYPVAHLQSEGDVFDEAGYRATVSRWLGEANPSAGDAYGSGDGEAQAESLCSGSFLLAVSELIEIGGSTLRPALLFYGVHAPAGAGAAPAITWTVLSASGIEILTGGSALSFVPEAGGAPGSSSESYRSVSITWFPWALPQSEAAE
jgi:hypothetical protein